jgi:hypothetical protein
MARTVKKSADGRRGLGARRAASSAQAVSKTKISSKHQVTIAKQPFEQAGFRAGEIVAVRALGPGRVELASLDALFEKHRGRLRTGGEFRRIVDELHAEWD